MEKYHIPWSDERALSALIVVVLLLVITIVLSAILAVFVTTMLPTENGPPSGRWTTESNMSAIPHQVTFRYGGAQTVDPDNLRFVISGARGSGAPNGEVPWSSLDDSTGTVRRDSAVTLDDRAINDGQGDLDLRSATIELKWSQADSAPVTTLETWRPGESE